jgi:hypothetical protein
MVRHPLYTQRPIKNDIGLVRLSKPVNFTSKCDPSYPLGTNALHFLVTDILQYLFRVGHISPICLLSGEEHKSEDYYEDKQPFIAGWGSTEFGGKCSGRAADTEYVALVPTYHDSSSRMGEENNSLTLEQTQVTAWTQIEFFSKSRTQI